MMFNHQKLIFLIGVINSNLVLVKSNRVKLGHDIFGLSGKNICLVTVIALTRNAFSSNYLIKTSHHSCLKKITITQTNWLCRNFLSMRPGSSAVFCNHLYVVTNGMECLAKFPKNQFLSSSERWLIWPKNHCLKGKWGLHLSALWNIFTNFPGVFIEEIKESD